MKVLLAVSLLLYVALAWPTTGPIYLPIFHVHRDIAYYTLNHPTIQPYVQKYKLNVEKISRIAATEPQYHKKQGFDKHPGFNIFRTKEFLKWKMNDTALGVLLHVVGDSGVGSCHSPACDIWCVSWAENQFEAHGELQKFPKSTDIYYGSYEQNIQEFYSQQQTMVRNYKTWWENNSYCPYFCNPHEFSKKGMELALKLGQTVMLKYFTSFTE